jgi:hypothetical protein
MQGEVSPATQAKEHRLATRVLRLNANAGLRRMILPPEGEDAGGLVIPSREPVTPFEHVHVEISFGPLVDEVVLDARVTEIREAPREIVVRIDPADHERVRYVRQVLFGGRRASARTHRRVNAHVTVRWRWAEGEHLGRLADLSRGGAFIESRRVPPLGCAIEIDFDLDEEPPMRVRSVVSRVRPDGSPEGFGVSFRLASRSTAARLARMVRRLES